MFIIILYTHFVCIAHIHIYMYIFDTHINIYLATCINIFTSSSDLSIPNNS